MNHSAIADLLEFIGLDAYSLGETSMTVSDSLGVFLHMAWNIIMVLAAAWAVGKIVQLVVGVVLRLARFDALADRLRLGALLRRIGVDNLPSYVVANVLYWAILLFGAVVSLNATQVTPVMRRLNELLMLIPAILSVLVILVITRYIAVFFSLVTRGVLGGAGIPHGARFGQVMFVLFWCAGVLAAAQALGFSPEQAMGVAKLAVIAASVALAVFLSTGAWMIGREIVCGMLVRSRLKVGEEIVIDAAPDAPPGTVNRFTGLAVEVYQGGNVLLVPYSRLGADIVRKKVI